MTACKECGSTYEVIDDLCADCETDTFVYCAICKEWQYRNDHCRHLRWTTCGGYGGSGALDIKPDYFKPGVFTFFTALQEKDPSYIPKFRRALTQNRFFSHVFGSIFHIETLDLHETVGETGSRVFASLEFGTLADWQKILRGYNWIASLEADQTPVANQLTVTWIDEWSKQLTQRVESCLIQRAS